MSLNKQLLCVGLILLSLPWAGCQYLRELDAGLKQSQQQNLETATAIIARSLSVSPEKLDPHGKLAPLTSPIEHTIYCHPLTIPVRADGYFEEWDNESQSIPWIALSEVSALRYRCGIFDKHLSLAFTIEDDDVIYNNPTQSLADNGDRLQLTTGEREYIFTAVAPGDIVARYFLNPHTTYRESRIDASWIDNDSGYQLEITMPMPLVHSRLGFSVVDETRHSGSHTQSSYGALPPPRFVYQATSIETTLATFQQEGIRLQLLNPAGWVIAKAGDPAVEQNGQAHWLLRKLYRAILETSNNTLTDYKHGQSNAVDLSQRMEVKTALTGLSASHWYRDVERQDYQLLSSAVPIHADGHLQAILVAEQSSEQTSALTDSAFNRLFSLSFAVFIVAVAVLLIYASWLSWRIRRLSNATQAALEDRNYQTTKLPNSHAKDEIGTLTRNYSELMKRIAEYTDYLQTLSRKLSHELRTPLAIIHSSLDNLASQALNANSQTYQQRAKDGAMRLGNILTAMSEARRVEESIEHAEAETIEIYSFIDELAQAYRDICPKHRIHTEFKTDTDMTLRISAVPDLLVQMLDKLMDNASDFCPADGVIKLGVEEYKNRIQLIVSNDGPLLPETMQSQLFDNMVSLRESLDDTVHLGLGLHIVRLIVDYHDGQVLARNRADNSGVEFIVSLPITPFSFDH